MSTSPNPNAPDCECRWFERAAKDPEVPVVFDEMMHEYNLINHRGGFLRLYHCPFCGGKAPKSLRASYWTVVSTEESRRLHQLTKDIRTPEELFAALGAPDSDFEISGGMTTNDSETEAPITVVAPRKVIFTSLSETADIHVTIDRYDRLKFSYRGRYIGPPGEKVRSDP